MGSTTSMCGAPTAAVPVALEHVQSPGGTSVAGRSEKEALLPGAASGTPTPAGGGGGLQARVREPAPGTGTPSLPAPPRKNSGGGPATAPVKNLAARRNFQGKLEVNTTSATKDQAAPGRERKRIKWCNSLSAVYDVGGEVMPSCHSGMQVLFGTQRSTKTPVVIKVRSKRQSFKEGEEKEWRISTEFMLNLPPSGSIAKLYEVLEDANSYYVIMEKCQGQDLFESLHGSTKLGLDEVKEVMHQILTALANLHAEGIIHKDLKLENVMLDKTPSTTGSAVKVWSDNESATGCNSPMAVKLVDFDTVEEYTPKTPKKTKDVLGTDQYIAQEAYAGNYSFASDVFAVGVIGYRLLVGKFPFDSRMFDDKPGENWVGSPKMKEIREKLCNYKINWEHKVFQREPEACHLLKSMLAVRESDRPTAKTALQHKWLSTSRSSSHSGAGNPVREASLPNCVQEANPAYNLSSR